MTGRLLITCPDRHGIVAAVAGFLADSGANIVSSDQHSTDPEGGVFFMRMEFNLERGDLEALGRASVADGSVPGVAVSDADSDGDTITGRGELDTDGTWHEDLSVTFRRTA